MQDADWTDDLRLIETAASAAGAIALGYFRQSPEVWWKNGNRSPVSAADYAANACLEDLLRPARPHYGWLSEETEDNDSRLACETLFGVDPIDGTRAFLAGEETWCVSVAVVHRGRPVAGVLFAPALEQTFSATLAGPALKNGLPIRVADEPVDTPARVAVAEDMLARLDPGQRGGIRRVNHVPSLAYRLAMAADGRIDGTFVKRNSHDWDLAAGDLILDRAGGRLTDLAGAPLVYNRSEVTHGVLCAAADPLHDRLLKALDPYRKS